MGYLFPGLFVLYVIYYFHSLDWDFYQIANINNLGKAINRTGDKFNFEKSVLIIIIAYVIGHLISYTSSLTVEILSNRFFGYPSKYLLQEDRPKYSELWKNYFKIRIESSSKIWKILKKAISYIAYGFIFLLLFPVSVIIISLGYLLDINQFIVRPLDKYLINSIKIRQQELAKRIGLKLPDVGQECDYHRIIMHYVYLNIPACQHKVDNYIALYGFLRCMTFIFCVLFDVFFFFGIYTIFEYNANKISIPLLGGILSLLALSYISFLAFVKFYRRQTLENFMSMLTGMPHDLNEGSTEN